MSFLSNLTIFLALSLFIFGDNVYSSTVKTRNKRIIDPDAKTDSYFELIKHQVMLIKDEIPYCSGTIIDERFILTAAHCVIDKRTNDFVEEPVLILAGTNTLHENDYHNRIYRYVEEIIVHARFVKPQRGYDIALLKLSKGFGPNPRLRQLDLPKPGRPFKNVYATVSGFGTDGIEDIPNNPTPIEHKPTNLRYQTVNILSEARCRELWGDVFRPGQICGRLNGSYTLRGLCKGDSGSGLVYGDEVIGVVSWGTHCNEGPGGRPTIFTKVSYFSELIDVVLGGDRNPDYVRARRYYINERFI